MPVVNASRRPIQSIGLILGALALAVTFALMAWYIMTTNVAAKTALQAAAVLWGVLPPLWFMLQWKLYPVTTRDDFEHFKYSQDCARAIWLGVGAVLAALVLH
jgi:uncharacterized membrane protein (GlpM family)